MKHKKKRLSLFLPLLLALTLLFPARTLPVQAESGTQDMAVHFLDVEQGLSILVQSGGENLLYDGGDTSHSDEVVEYLHNQNVENIDYMISSHYDADHLGVQSGGENLLYDGGDTSHSDEVVEYLHNQNVENIDYMISSHYDADHLGGLLKCFQNFSVENILGADYYQGTDLYMDFVNAATANAISIQYPKPGDTFSFGTGSFTVLAPSGIDPNDSNENSVVIRLTATANAISIQYPKPGDTFSFGTGSFTVLAPSGIDPNDSNENSVVIRLTNGNNSFLFTGDAEETSDSFGTGSFTVLAPSGIDPNDSNENSVVIRLTNGNNSFLFTGDAEETSEQDMISTGRNLDCDVLSLGHHGSSSSTTWDFLEASTPSWAVISCGAENKYGHPSADTMGRLSSMNIPVFRTDKQGTIVALSDGENISWNQEPCNDYSSGDSSSEISVPSSEDSSDFLESGAVQ